MKNKTNLKIILAFLLGLVIAGSIGVYATIKIQASEIGYNDTTVDQVLDELYTKKSQGVQVATLTTQGETYTMQNDGYITGTVTGHGSEGTGEVYFDGNLAFQVVGASRTRNVSLYAPKDTAVSTRTSYGTYNLTVYEWK